MHDLDKTAKRAVALPIAGPPSRSELEDRLRGKRRNRKLLGAGLAIVIAALAATVILSLLVARGPGGETVATEGDSVPSTVTPSEGLATLRVAQRQVECCYREGSVGLLSLSTPEGTPVGEVSVASQTVEEGGEFISSFDDAQVSPGTYRASVLQLVCPGEPCEPIEATTLAEIEGSLIEVCATELTVEAGQVIELEAIWAPGTGCLSFEETGPR